MTLNTITPIPTNGGTFASLNDSQFASVTISPTKVLLIYMQTLPNAMYAQVINLSGATAPILRPVTLINTSVSGVAPGIRVSMLTPSKAFVSFRILDSLENTNVYGQIIDIDINDNIMQGPVSSALFSAHQEYGFNAILNNTVIYCVMDGMLSAATRVFNTWSIPINGNIIGTPIIVKTETSLNNTDGFNVLSVGNGSYVAFINGIASLYNSTNTLTHVINGIDNIFQYFILLNTNIIIAMSNNGTYHTIDIVTNIVDVDTVFTTPSADLNMISILKINNETIFTLGVSNVPVGIYSTQHSYIFRNVGPGLAIFNNNNPLTIIPDTWITPRSVKPSRHTQLHLIDANHILFISLFGTGPSTIVFDIFEQL